MAADTSAGRCWEWTSTEPWPRCCLHRVWLKILRSHFFLVFLSTCSLSSYMCAHIKWNHSLRTHACKRLLSICVCESTCMWVRVMYLALSCHFTCHPAISLGSQLWHGWVNLGVVCGDPSKHWQRCVWPTAYNCQFVTSPGLALTLACCDTGLGVSRKHDMASTEPRLGAKGRNAKWAFAVTDRRNSSSLFLFFFFATCPTQAQMGDLKAFKCYNLRNEWKKNQLWYDLLGQTVRKKKTEISEGERDSVDALIRLINDSLFTIVSHWWQITCV